MREQSYECHEILGLINGTLPGRRIDWPGSRLISMMDQSNPPHFIRDPDAGHYAVRSHTNADNNGLVVSTGRKSMDTQLLVEKPGKYRGSSD
ncbi:Uncharacterized protein DBV15_05613 [Temnothorax longispinosus]|uniref:Uncharacterized protein n=1 Tax=Temnothorax longispinosus TaxID=300112 RepID=A0A4S2K1U5_9HYME|nr:Uncharacterized protein DBV15_05613 [Temnothorax longispinosus]